MKRIALTILIWMLAISALSAKQRTVALVPLQAKNCSGKIAQEATYLLEKYLVANKRTLIDSKKLATLMADFNLSAVTSEFDAKKLAKYAEADDLIHGTISKESRGMVLQTDYYIITLYVLEKQEWNIKHDKYFSEKKHAELYYEINEQKGVFYYKLKQAVSERLTKLYLRDEVKPVVKREPLQYSGFAEFACGAPFGRFSTVSAFGYGMNLGMVAEGAQIKSIRVNGSVRSGFFYYAGDAPAVRHVLLVPLTLAVSRSFDLFQNIRLEPVVAGGFLFSFMSHDDEHYPGESYRYTTSVYADPLLSVSLEAHYSLSQNIDIVCAPSYALFFENGGVGHIFGIALGARYRL